MNSKVFQYQGEDYLHCSEVGQIFEVESIWLLEVHRVGLVQTCIETETGLSFALIEFDRIAKIIWMHGHLGLNLDEIVREMES
ncbi:MAG: hypothetical protein O3A95_07930 [Planctomycetota bacterium]|nr:hypothetical protein [Planctomycetota bacterium]MDA1114210.1 hypothetical protein [Planctomycetota bacterium]